MHVGLYRVANMFFSFHKSSHASILIMIVGCILDVRDGMVTKIKFTAVFLMFAI